MKKLIDDKGRLFGKINLIDLAVIIILLAVAGRFLLQVDFSTANEGVGVTANNEQTIRYDCQVLKVRQATVNAVQVGDAVVEAATNNHLGTVVDVIATPFVEEVFREDGTSVLVESQIYQDLTLVIEGKGSSNANTVLIGKTEIRVGKQLSLKSAHFNIVTNVWRIEAID